MRSFASLRLAVNSLSLRLLQVVFYVPWSLYPAATLDGAFPEPLLFALFLFAAALCLAGR